MKHGEIEGDWYANGQGAIDHQLAVFRVTRRRAGGHPTRTLQHTLKPTEQEKKDANSAMETLDNP
jgi:hypothetical protein